MAAKKAESKSQMAELKKQLSENKLQKLYLFFGEETFLIDVNIDRISALVPDMGFEDFNRLVLDGSSVPLSEIADAIEAFPMMAEKKLVIIKNSGAFKGKASQEIKEFYINKIENIQCDTVVIFKETDVDKRSTVYKAAQKAGWTGEFTKLDDTDLVTWVMREVKVRDRKISKENAAFLISITDRSLQTLKNEIDKLSSYTEDEITKVAIERLASRSLEARVFDLCDAIMEKDAGKSLLLIRELKTNKESPYGILYILFSTFSKMLKAQVLSDRHEPYDAYAGELGVPAFSVKKYVAGAKRFTKSELAGFLMMAVETDLSIKQGNIEQWQAIERLALYGAERKANG